MHVEPVATDFLLSLVVRCCIVVALHGVNACTVWSIAFMIFYSLWNCIFYNAGSSITSEAFSSGGGNNILKLTSNIVQQLGIHQPPHISRAAGPAKPAEHIHWVFTFKKHTTLNYIHCRSWNYHVSTNSPLSMGLIGVTMIPACHINLNSWQGLHSVHELYT